MGNVNKTAVAASVLLTAAFVLSGADAGDVGALGPSPKYEPVGCDTGVKGRATGFFRLEMRDDGRWWVMDPLGRGIVLLGVDHVTYHGHWCEATGKFHHLEEMKKRFPDEEDWRKDAVGRLRRWGFNLLGAGSSDSLRHRGLLHTVFLSVGDEWAFDKNEDLWICPNEGRPCSAFPNVFHPGWRSHCDDVAKRKCAPNRNDPWLFGYFIDNELAWWGRSSEWGVSGTGLFDEAMKRREGHSAREAALEFAAKAGVKDGEKVPDTVKLAFLRRAAELYFEGACEAIRRADPNHLVLGARFAGTSGANPVVWETSGAYCDLVTFNCYPFADIDRNIVYNDPWRRKDPVAEVFGRIYDMVKKPLLVTEWSFPALDSGLPCTEGAGQRFRTQAERTAATELFAKSMLAMPFVIGYDYFMWVDEPALGISKAFPENTNYGLISEKGDAYPEITQMFQRLHADIAKWRLSPPPPVLPAMSVPRSGIPCPIDTVKKGEGAWTREKDGVYSIGNDAGLVLEGRLGGSSLFEKVSAGDDLFGRLDVMMSFPAGERTAWCSARSVESFRKTGDGRAAITVRGESFGFEYSAEVDVAVVPGETKYVANIRRITNVGQKPIELQKAFFQQGADGMGEVSSAKEVPLLWKAPSRAAWVAADGRFHGAYSMSPDARNFAYWRDAHGLHADAWFEPEGSGPMVLAPGETWEPRGAVYIVGCVGRGGSAAWRAVVGAVLP